MSGYAVVDLETTGFAPSGHHRIVEVAVVLLDQYGVEEFRWETLVNPHRDLGPQHVHGIAAADVRHAPDFAEVAPDLLSFMSGRAFVAHNAAFDRMFINDAYSQLGFESLIEDAATVCTMKWASRFFPGQPRNLAACCSAAGVNLVDAHRASADAAATAQLLGWYLQASRGMPPWAAAVTQAERRIWPQLARKQYQPCVRTAEGQRGDFVSRLVESLPGNPGDSHAVEYLGLMDRALLDRQLSEREKDTLVQLASDRGIDRQQARALHESYLRDLATLAWADGVVTAEERRDLETVADLLGLAASDIILAAQQPAADVPAVNRFTLSPGDRVVFTGQMMRPRDQWAAEALAAGLEPADSVTKKTALVVAADPDSLSGKAKKAEKYGIPIVGEDGFAEMLKGIR